MNSLKVLAVTVLLAMTANCSSDDGGDDAGTVAPRLQVVLDYSPTLSDAGALLYLASNPVVDLLAVTLPGTGEADCEPGVRITRALLTVAGAADVPIGCGRNTPLVGDRDWPDEWRAASNSFAEGLLPTVAPAPVADAEQLLGDTLRAATEPVTLVAVGPLTNLGVVLGDDPELADHLARVVIMGGALAVPGNVEAAPTAEWNIYVDPEAARRVIAAGAPVTFVALDATNYLAWNDRLLARLGALKTAASDLEHEVAASTELDGFYLWDELAAMTAVDPTLVTTESVVVRIDDDGALVRDVAGLTVDVAIGANTDRAQDEFVSGLNGGTVPRATSLTAAELDYFVAVGGADSDAGVSMSRVFDSSNDPEADAHLQAATFINGFLDAVNALATELRAVSVPSALATAHDEYVASLDKVVAHRSEALALIAASDGSTVDEILHEVQLSELADDFNRVGAACQVLVDYSFLREGPRPCSFEG
ncbi:MAG: nucleoside hydrolase [Actinomycetia bacterium]|nr:nucleoside hydrolase [Actinomycetes bacterium]